MLRHTAILFVLLLSVATVCQAQVPPTTAATQPNTTVAGTVFVDANGNGRLDAGEKVAVGSVVWLHLSDGRGGWLTNGDGKRPTPQDLYSYPVTAQHGYTFNLVGGTYVNGNLQGGSFQLHVIPPAGYVVGSGYSNPLTFAAGSGLPATINVPLVPQVAPQPPPVIPPVVVLPPPLVPAVPTTPPTTAPAVVPVGLAQSAHTFFVGADVDGGQPVATYTLPVAAPATLHVNALPLTAARDDFKGERYAWTFGDPNGGQTAVDPTTGQTVNLDSGQVWPVAAYVYEQPGTYAVKLTRTTAAGQVLTYSATVTVPASTRTAMYVDPVAGNDANAGTPAAPYKTLPAAWAHVRSHTAVLLKTGGTYVANQLWIAVDDLLVDRYGDPAQPDPAILVSNPTHYSPVDVAVFNFSAACSNVTVRHVCTDCTWTTVKDPYGRPYEAADGTFGYVRGRNVTVSDLTFNHSFNGYHGTGDLHGGLVLRCRQVGNGVTSQSYWFEGSDFVAIGNRGLNSSLESTLRSAETGIVRGTIALDEHAQLVNAVYLLGSQKCPVTLRTLSDVTVYHVHAVNGYLELAPRSPATLVQHVLVDSPLVDGGWLWLKTNVRYTTVRNPVIRMTLAGGGDNCVEMGSNGNGVDLWNEGNSVTGTVASGPPGCRLLEVDPLPAGAIRGDTFEGVAVTPGLRLPMAATVAVKH